MSSRRKRLTVRGVIQHALAPHKSWRQCHVLFFSPVRSIDMGAARARRAHNMSVTRQAVRIHAPELHVNLKS